MYCVPFDLNILAGLRVLCHMFRAHQDIPVYLMHYNGLEIWSRFVFMEYYGIRYFI